MVASARKEESSSKCNPAGWDGSKYKLEYASKKQPGPSIWFEKKVREKHILGVNRVEAH